jgi:hypothetical protein
MRVFRSLVMSALLLLVGGAASRPMTPIASEDIAIRSTAVMLDASDPSRTRAGHLVLLAGWRLTSRSAQFGGWSALHMDGDRATLIGDSGDVLRFRLGRFGHAIDARIDPLPAGCGRQDDKTQRDSESLTGDGHDWWVGFEYRNRLCRMSGDFGRALAVRAPPEMARWKRTGGAEAMLRLSDGRFLVFSEVPPTGEAERSMLVFAGDPTDPATRVVRRPYRPPEGYSPTDAAELPDGRILVLNRRFSLPDLFTNVLTIVDPAALDSAGSVTGSAIATLVPPTLHDNFEGLAVTREGGRTIVWMVSDDNFMSWQATYLLKFALDPPPAKTP